MSPIRPTRPEFEAADGVVALPLATPTLPPATHTNAVLVGREDVWIVDPASPHEAARRALLARVERLATEGRTPRGIFLTHHHRDHTGAAAWLRERTGLGIWAHPTTARLLEGELAVDHPIVGGDVLAGSPDQDDWWHVLHTPGHAPGHLCLWQPRQRVLIAGDMVASAGTIIVAPPDGHMATYVAQLERLAALEPVALVPAHGGLITEPVAVLRRYVAHRLEREAKVLEALSGVPVDVPEITRRAYRDVPPAVHGLARGSTLAHLIKLAEEGRARASGDGRWVRT